MEYVSTIIGLYAAGLLFCFAAHALLYSIDVELYKKNRFNENRKVVMIGVNWLFWRYRKNNDKEIFFIVFVHEIVNLFLMIFLTFLMIISFILENDILMLVLVIIIFLYFCYIILLEEIWKRKKQ